MTAATTSPSVLWVIKGLAAGGAEQLLLNHARATLDADVRYSCAYLRPDLSDLVPALNAVGVETTCLEATNDLDLRWARHLRRLIDENDFDVLHVHSPSVAAVVRLVVRSIPRRRRPALLYTEHANWPAYNVLTRLANAATFPLNDEAFVVSKEVASSIPPRLRRNVELLVHGVDVAAIREQQSQRAVVRRELGISESEIVVGTVANLRPSKGYADLLAAARQVVGQRSDVTFLAVGQGPLEHELNELHARSRLGDRFRFLGYREDAIRVMSTFDVFCLSSHFEGLPVALMEALSLGLPIVATTVGGIPEAISPGVQGLLVSPHRSSELADALITLASDQGIRTRMSEAAVERAIRFDVRVSADRLLMAYSAPPASRRVRP